jgi:hypothetical protein
MVRLVAALLAIASVLAWSDQAGADPLRRHGDALLDLRADAPTAHARLVLDATNGLLNGVRARGAIGTFGVEGGVRVAPRLLVTAQLGAALGGRTHAGDLELGGLRAFLTGGRVQAFAYARAGHLRVGDDDFPLIDAGLGLDATCGPAHLLLQAGAGTTGLEAQLGVGVSF